MARISRLLWVGPNAAECRDEIRRIKKLRRNRSIAAEVLPTGYEKEVKYDNTQTH